MNIKTIQVDEPSERRPVERFLNRQGLSYDEDVTQTITVFSGGEMIGTGSLAGNVVKCVAVAPGYQGEALTNKIVTYLELEAYHRGIYHLFLFTRAENRRFFESLGFSTVAFTEANGNEVAAEKSAAGDEAVAGKISEKGAAPQEAAADKTAGDESDEPTRAGVALLEKPAGEVDAWLRNLSKEKREGKATSLVMNCNPFTLGHRYLVEKASERAAVEGGVVHLFVVSAERSFFPQEVRYRLVKEGCRDLDDVVVHHGGPYIISGATFPSYFLRNSEEIAAVQAELDLRIFAEKIAPTLGIARRMAGSEPYCPVTGAYNEAMRRVLPRFGVEFEEIPRLEKDKQVVSASTVRELIRDGRLEEVEELVPRPTWEFLRSEEAVPIIERIKRENRRH